MNPNPAAVRALGLMGTVAYASFVVWLYVERPRSVGEVTGGVASAVGMYEVDRAQLERGRAAFRADRFGDARAAFARADPARRDPVTQFYVAYSYYREGWGRFYNDDTLFRQGLLALDHAVSLTPERHIHVDDPELGLPDSDALRVELQHGQSVELRDFNPLRVLRKRQ
jgi:hypothetical protein